MQTKKITLTPSYIDISEGNTNLVFRIASNLGGVRVVMSDVEPADDTVEYLTINNGNPWIFPLEVEPGSRIWARSLGGVPVDIVIATGNLGSSVSVATGAPAATNRSGTIAAGGTSQVVSTGAAPRTSLVIQNISAGDLWVSEFGAAAVDTPGSYKIVAGATFTILTKNQVTIIGASTGQKFTATEIGA